MTKYRYVMTGSFVPQNKQFLTNGDVLHAIDIPCPYVRDSYDEALKDDKFAYRFGYKDGGVGIYVFFKENYTVTTDGQGRKYLDIKTVGTELAFIDYQTFKRCGGLIYNIPKEACCSINPTVSKEAFQEFEKWIEESKDFSWDSKDYEIEATFNDLFPHLHECSPLVYIDNEAYDVLVVEP